MLTHGDKVFDNHQSVSEAEYTGKNIRMPSKEEAPYLDMQVMNYHRPIFGTFHSKFMVVDRKYGIVSSNNIQDNDNVEMVSSFARFPELFLKNHF